ncbi:24161_t:CDS:2 [Gigaspora margarita]|uniref:24161_t:CDS:1 n=1 Tax=Gigaspora margarita TaxID=4874 RepID=A0ABN7US90_GIGMA|nr:24161_t:CDS:2 [Gigaspora margarita]
MSSEISLDKDDGATLTEIPIDNGTRTITNRKKILGILYGLGYNLNYIIGEDAFNPNNIWTLVRSPGITLVLYFICGIISLLGSSVYIELGIRSLPSGIGEQKYITDAFPSKRNVGHIFSFVAIFVIFPSIIVAESFTSAQYLLYFYQRSLDVNWITMATSVAMLFIITLYQVCSNRVSDIINHSLALFKIITLLIISIVGIAKLRIDHVNWNYIFNVPFDLGAYASGLIKVLLTYEDLIEEFKPSSDNLEYPSVILKYSSLISVGITFILCKVVEYNINDNESTPIPMRFGKELLGETGEILMSILVAISSFGCVSAIIFTEATEEFIDETDQSEETISEAGRD